MYSKGDWTESWAACIGWSCLVPGELDWVISRSLFPPQPFYDSGIQCSLNRWKPRHVLEFENAACIWFQRTIFSFISHQVQFLSRLLIANNVLPLFLFSGLLYSAWMQSSTSLKGCCRWTKLFPIFLYRSGF